MPFLAWLLIALAPRDGGEGDASVATLVERLGSPEETDRFAAVDALDALGFQAMSALRAEAANGSGGSRRLAGELVARIGSRRLLRPTVANVEVKDVPSAEALGMLAKASGIAVDLGSEADPRWLGRRVTLGRPGPVPFFEALAALGGQGGFCLDAGPAWSFKAPQGLRVRVVPTDLPPPPMAHAGPYRVTMLRLSRRREAVQARGPSESRVRQTFSASLELVAEPGIVLEKNGPIRLVEATDDRGRDLSSASADPGTHQNYFVRTWDSPEAATLAYEIPLDLPEDRGRRIVRLRGVIPLVALARTDEVASWPAGGLAGKAATLGTTRITFSKGRLDSPSPSLEATVFGARALDHHSFADGPRQTTLATLRLPFSLDDHVRIEDARGVAYRSHSNPTSAARPDGGAPYAMTVYPGRPVEAPARVRVFGVAGVATEVPFEFTDLPIP